MEEPVFVERINQGMAAQKLRLDHWPTELSFGNLIRITYPSGKIAGHWKHEGRTARLQLINQYELTLTPLIAEAKDADFNANYSADTTQPNPALGAVTFDVPVRQALAQTLHLKARNVRSDGQTHAYVFNYATAFDPLSQALVFAGPGWWWTCDGLGNVDLTNAAPFTHDVMVGREVSVGEWSEDIISLTNGQPVMGSTGPDGVTSFTAFAVDTNPANPFSVPNIGRRTAQMYQDTSLVDQNSVNAVAASLLAYGERVTSTRTVTLTNYTVRRPRCGDAIVLRDVNSTLADPTKDGPISVEGPYSSPMSLSSADRTGFSW